MRYWLYFIAFLVAMMVIVGGATRLTDSGLSITEWKPLLGAIPPISEAHWLEEFAKYKLIPEYQEINKGMSLDAFKFIYWWEWGHRFLGRFVGLAFALPLAFFWITGRLNAHLKPRLVLLLVLGGLQGAIGWWMVASGLVDRTDVSQYRLAVHLTLACVIFAYAIWLARGLAPHTTEPASRGSSRTAAILVGLILFQIYLGALVAGLNAGLAFNTWPKMDGAWWPSGLHAMEPLWRNYFESPKTVQFVHRLGAYLVLIAAFVHMIQLLRSEAGTRHARRGLVLMALVAAQAMLGIITLVLAVPLDWALFHQGGAVVVLGFAVAHLRGMRATAQRV